MELDYIYGVMEDVFKVIGEIIKWMEVVYLHGLMAESNILEKININL